MDFKTQFRFEYRANTEPWSKNDERFDSLEEIKKRTNKLNTPSETFPNPLKTRIIKITETIVE